MCLKQIALFSFFILAFSCNEKVEQNNFFASTISRWTAGTGVSWKNSHYEKSERVNEPMNTIQPILEVEFIDASFSKVSDCIFYEIPKEDDFGVLFVVENPKREKCKKLIQNKRYAEIKNIINFGYENKNNKLLLKIDEKRFEYEFLNHFKNIEYNLLSSSEAQKSIITASVDYQKPLKILNNGDTCFEVDNDCNIIKEDECDQCTGGYYGIINNNCKTTQTKVCGINNCGLKNQVACLRGYTVSGIDPETYCVNGSPLGFCQQGLKVICENGILICE